MAKFNGMPAAATPAESIKLALEILRKLETSRQGAVSGEMLLTLGLLLMVVSLAGLMVLMMLASREAGVPWSFILGLDVGL